MELSVVTGDITAQAVNAIVVNLFEGVDAPGGGTGAVDTAIGGAISSLIADGEIKGRRGEVTVIHTIGDTYAGFAPDRVLVVGLGKSKNFDMVRIHTKRVVYMQQMKI